MLSNTEIKRRLIGEGRPKGSKNKPKTKPVGARPSKRLNKGKQQTVNFYCGNTNADNSNPEYETTSNSLIPQPAPTFNSILPLEPPTRTPLHTRPEAPPLETNYKRPPKLEKAIPPAEVMRSKEELAREAHAVALSEALAKRRAKLEGSGALTVSQIPYNKNSIMGLYLDRYCSKTEPSHNSILGLYKKKYCEITPIQEALNTITKNIRKEEKYEEAPQESVYQAPVLAKPLVRDYIATNSYSSVQLAPQTLQRPIAELISPSRGRVSIDTRQDTQQDTANNLPANHSSVSRLSIPTLGLNTTPYAHKVSEATTDTENKIELNKALEGTANTYVKTAIPDFLSQIRDGKILKTPVKALTNANTDVKPDLNQFQIDKVIQDKADQIRKQVEDDEYDEEWDGSGLKKVIISRQNTLKGYGFKGGCDYCSKEERQKMDLFKTMQIRNLYGF